MADGCRFLMFAPKQPKRRLQMGEVNRDNQWQPKVGDEVPAEDYGVIEEGVTFVVIAVLDDKTTMCVDLVEGTDLAYGCDDATNSLNELLAVTAKSVVEALSTAKKTKRTRLFLKSSNPISLSVA